MKLLFAVVITGALAGCSAGNNNPMGMHQGMGMGMGQTSTVAPKSTDGKEIFAALCAVCHNADSAEKKVGPGLKGLFHSGKLYNGKKANEENIRAVINDGAPGMPGSAKTLTKQQLKALIGYLKTL